MRLDATMTAEPREWVGRIVSRARRQQRIEEQRHRERIGVWDMETRAVSIAAV